MDDGHATRHVVPVLHGAVARGCVGAQWRGGQTVPRRTYTGDELALAAHLEPGEPGALRARLDEVRYPIRAPGSMAAERAGMTVRDPDDEME